MSNIDFDRLYAALDWEPLHQDQHGNDIGHCFDPFGWHNHGDRTGKFVFYKETERASCFVCGGFTLPRLISILQDTDEEDGEEWLDQFREGFESSDESFRLRIHDKLDYKYSKKQKTLPRPSPQMLNNFQPYYKWDNIAVQWAEDRGINPNIIEELGLRFGNVRRMPPMDTKAESYQGPAIIIPHYWNNVLVGWQYRWLANDLPMWLQKYTNTKDFPKEQTIYNFDRVKNSTMPVIICESVSTVAWLQSNDLPAVATFGAKVTEGQLKALRRLQQGIIFSPDNDDASLAWMSKMNKLEPFIPTKTLDRVQLKGPKDHSDLGSLAPDKEALFRHLATL